MSLNGDKYSPLDGDISKLFNIYFVVLQIEVLFGKGGDNIQTNVLLCLKAIKYEHHFGN